MSINFEDKRVLIIDDHPGMRSSMRAILSAFGVTQSEMAGTANDAIRRLKNKSYDIIVCDYFLGEGSDGQQLLEQLRHNNLISLSTVFMMITAESVYERVVSAVELAPDDYLIKPFTAEVLKSRLERVMQKKNIFAPIYRLIEANNLPEATRICAELTQQKSKYTIDLMRLLAELHVTQGNFDEAQKIYQQVIALRAVPWARMGLAKMLHYRGRDDEAATVLEEVVEEAVEFMEAYDLLAKVCESQGKTERAQAVLEQAAAASPFTLHRQKDMGQLALRNGDLEAAERAFCNVIERGKTSFFRNPDDYANLCRVQMQSGKLDAATATLREARDSFTATPDTQFTTSVIESLIADAAGNKTAAEKALNAALDIKAKNNIKSSEDISLDLAKACFAQGRDDEAKEIVNKLVQNNHESQILIQKAKALFESVGKGEEGSKLVEQSVKSIIDLNNQGVLKAKAGDLDGSVKLLTEAATRLPENVQIVLNAAQALLVHIDKLGWSEDRMETAQRYIEMARDKNPAHPKLPGVTKLMQDISRKYGVDAL